MSEKNDHDQRKNRSMNDGGSHRKVKKEKVNLSAGPLQKLSGIVGIVTKKVTKGFLSNSADTENKHSIKQGQHTRTATATSEPQDIKGYGEYGVPMGSGAQRSIQAIVQQRNRSKPTVDRGKATSWNYVQNPGNNMRNLNVEAVEQPTEEKSK